MDRLHLVSKTIIKKKLVKIGRDYSLLSIDDN